MSTTTLTYTESSATYSNGIRRDFVFIAPAGYVPVIDGTLVWKQKDTSKTSASWETIDSDNYTIAYPGGGTQATVSSQVNLTLDDSVDAPDSSVIFDVSVESQIVGASSYTAPTNITGTNYIPSDYRGSFPQIDMYPGITDDVIVNKINEICIYCNKRKFGKFYKTAMGLLVSHVLSLEIASGLYTKNGSGMGLTIGMSSAGPMNSVSAGSVSYSQTVENKSGSNINEWLKGTGWGQKFLVMRDMVSAPMIGISGF